MVDKCFEKMVLRKLHMILKGVFHGFWSESRNRKIKPEVRCESEVVVVVFFPVGCCWKSRGFESPRLEVRYRVRGSSPLGTQARCWQGPGLESLDSSGTKGRQWTYLVWFYIYIDFEG